MKPPHLVSMLMVLFVVTLAPLDARQDSSRLQQGLLTRKLQRWRSIPLGAVLAQARRRKQRKKRKERRENERRKQERQERERREEKEQKQEEREELKEKVLKQIEEQKNSPSPVAKPPVPVMPDGTTLPPFPRDVPGPIPLSPEDVPMEDGDEQDPLEQETEIHSDETTTTDDAPPPVVALVLLVMALTGVAILGAHWAAQRHRESTRPGSLMF